MGEIEDILKRKMVWIITTLVFFAFSLAFYSIYFAPVMILGEVLNVTRELFAFTIMAFTIIMVGSTMRAVKKGDIIKINDAISLLGLRTFIIIATASNYVLFLLAVILGYLSYGVIGTWAFIVPLLWIQLEVYLPRVNPYFSPSSLVAYTLLKHLTRKKEYPDFRFDIPPYLIQKVSFTNQS